MALPAPHHRSESNIPPLPTRQMTAEFRRQTNAQLAALKKVRGRPPGTAARSRQGSRS